MSGIGIFYARVRGRGLSALMIIGRRERMNDGTIGREAARTKLPQR